MYIVKMCYFQLVFKLFQFSQRPLVTSQTYSCNSPGQTVQIWWLWVVVFMIRYPVNFPQIPPYPAAGYGGISKIHLLVLL